MAGSRRVNLKAILADPDLRRELMVTTIQATQAREGIETTRPQAERAYYVVSEAERTAFFGLDSFREQGDRPDRRHQIFVATLRGEAPGVRFDIARRDFGFISGSPLVYSQVKWLVPLYKEFPALVPSYGQTRSGLNTTEIERFTRHRWEVHSGPRRWVQFAKGGDFCRFYSDWDIVFDWTETGREFKQVVADKYGSPSRFVKSEDEYFKAGITWMQTTNLGINARILEPLGIFGVASPSFFPRDEADMYAILGLMNSAMFDAIARCVANRNWGATAVGSIPVPALSDDMHATLGQLAHTLHDAKATWDEGNEISTRFRVPWLLRPDLIPDPTTPLPARLDLLATFEAREEASIQALYADLNDAVYRLYGITDHTRKVIEDTLGERPPEILWPQMEGQTPEQKRTEHVYRLLSHAVAIVLAEDQDGIVPFHGLSGETPLLDRLHHALARLLPGLDPVALDVDLTNELKRRVKGYRAVEDLAGWLRDAFFEHHLELYKHRPIRWHLTSRADLKAAALDVLVDYHRFDKDRLRKLRAPYVKDAASHLRRESALAGNAGNADLRTWYSEQADEVDALDRKLQEIQEGKGSYAIGTPWKAADARPKGWDPDLDDGVKVNIAPFVAAGLLRSAKGL